MPAPVHVLGQKWNLNACSITRELIVWVITPNVFGAEMSRAGGPKLEWLSPNRVSS